MTSSPNAADPVVRPPKQDRSRKTLARILESALGLFDQNGVEETSVSQIVKNARSSVGSFYGRFEGKDDLVRFLHRQLWEDAEARWWQQEGEVDWSEVAPAARVDELVRIFMEVARQDYGVRTALSLDGALTPEDREQASSFDQRVRDRFSHHLDGSDTPERPVSFAAALTLAAVRDHLAGRLLPDHDLPDDRFADELSLVLKSYLGPVFEGVMVERATRRDGNRPTEVKGTGPVTTARADLSATGPAETGRATGAAEAPPPSSAEATPAGSPDRISEASPATDGPRPTSAAAAPATRAPNPETTSTAPAEASSGNGSTLPSAGDANAQEEARVDAEPAAGAPSEDEDVDFFDVWG